MRETKAEVAARAQGVIGKIWRERPDDWCKCIAPSTMGQGLTCNAVVGVTAHSGFINGVLLALGSKPYPLPTGGTPLAIHLDCSHSYACVTHSRCSAAGYSSNIVGIYTQEMYEPQKPLT